MQLGGGGGIGKMEEKKEDNVKGKGRKCKDKRKLVL
jgi:hypothetical protein